ncbi:zinc finger, RING-CH-type containing protein [Tanacetum coccineum]
MVNGSSEMIMDLECGGGALHDTSTTDQSCYHSQEDEEVEEEVGSCYSQFYNSNDSNEEEEEISRLSSFSDCSVVQIHDNLKNVVVIVVDGSVRRDCRICQLSVDADDDEEEEDELMELGCCCKDDLALAHKHCADAWFKIKGNK